MFVVDQHPSTRMPPAISHRSHQSPPVKPPNLTSFTNKLKLQKNQMKENKYSTKLQKTISKIAGKKKEFMKAKGNADRIIIKLALSL